MKVKELIEALQKCDEDATVIVTSNNFELNNAMLKARGVHQFDNGSTTKESFRDAFDGGTYTEDTWSIIGGTEKVVTIR